MKRSVNEYGVEISVHECDVCGRQFTVCPPRNNGENVCLAVGCESYDVTRDVELFWDSLPIRRYPVSGEGDW